MQNAQGECAMIFRNIPKNVFHVLEHIFCVFFDCDSSIKLLLCVATERCYRVLLPSDATERCYRAMLPSVATEPCCY